MKLSERIKKLVGYLRTERSQTVGQNPGRKYRDRNRLLLVERMEDRRVLASVSLSSPPQLPYLSLLGRNVLAIEGLSVKNAGDINEDGFADLLVGARMFDAQGKSTFAVGCSHVVFGGQSLPNAIELDSPSVLLGDVVRGESNDKGLVSIRKTSSSAGGSSSQGNGSTGETKFAIDLAGKDDLRPGQILDPRLDSGISFLAWRYITVSLGEQVSNATDVRNYELRRAGTDGLLLSSDVPYRPVRVTTTGTKVLLDFGDSTTFRDDTYRLTIRDTLVDSKGLPFDGDGDGVAGGNWVRDFVAYSGVVSNYCSYEDLQNVVDPWSELGIGPVQRLEVTNGRTIEVDNGCASSGQLIHDSGNAFDGLNRLQVGGAEFFSPKAGSEFFGELRVKTSTAIMSGLEVHREILVPNDGNHSIVRTLDFFRNTESNSVSVPVRLFGNLGSDASTSVFATSDGDLIVEPTDVWFGTDDSDPIGGTPAVIHLMGNDSGFVLKPTNVALN